jgi:putative phosphoribosyl transferase
MSFLDRTDAGRRLGRALSAYAGRGDVIVLGLPRGGVPVAAEVARALGAPLDVLLVRKLGVPGHEELAMGAIAEGGGTVVNKALVNMLGISDSLIRAAAEREGRELDARQHQYRGTRPPPVVSNRTVIVVDDGLATGASMEAAVMVLRPLGPAALVVAAPVGAADTCVRLRQLADAVVCLETPPDFGAVGEWYDDFTQTSDDEVRRLLS